MDVETDDATEVSPEAATPVLDDLAKMRELAKASGDKWREEHAKEEEPAAEAPTAETLEEAKKPAANLADVAPAKPDDEEPEPELRRLLRAREEKQEAREERQTAAQEKAEAQRALAEAKQLLAQVQAEKDLITRRLRSEPTRAMRELGVDPGHFAESVAREGTPEAAYQAVVAELKGEIQSLRAELKGDVTAIQEARKQEYAQYEAMKRDATEKAFIAMAAPDKYPHLRARFDTDKAVVDAAYARINECVAKGVACTDQQVLEDLEHEAKGWAKKAYPTLSELLQKVMGEAAAGAADQGERASKGPRTLSAQSASERRATPKPISQLTADEAEAEMRRIAREAMGSATTPATKANGKAQRH